MKISSIILLSFFDILLLFSITTFIVYQQTELIKKNATMNERSANVVQSSNRFQRNFLTMVSGLRGYLLTQETCFRQTYDSTLRDNRIFPTLQEKTTVDSVGVGLAIVKKILSDRKLFIEIGDVHSGTGTVFSFTWPKK